jgi:hypothetical protein
MPEATLSISLRLARRDIEQLKARAHIRDMSAAHLDLAVANAGRSAAGGLEIFIF